MNRRAFFASVAALGASPARPPAPEQALSLPAPWCPSCGSAAMFVTPCWTTGEYAKRREPVPTECYCGWKGVTPWR